MAFAVAPPAGAWIETLWSDNLRLIQKVAPPAGAWIETLRVFPIAFHSRVAPPAGAWIETLQRTGTNSPKLSLPPRERGLKL